MNRKVLGIVIAATACLGWDLIKRTSTRHNRGIAKGKRFIILGAGFAGVEACRELERLLPGSDNGEIVLVNDTEYLLFTPMLTEAVGGDIEPNHIIVPLKSYIRRTKLVIGEAQDIDLKSRAVSVTGIERQTLRADQLVISLGASTNFHQVPGAEQSAIEMKTLEDANQVRQGALALVKAAAREHDPAERDAMLSFLVAGGGYTGVETIAALNELVRETAAEYEELAGVSIRMLIVEPLERLMSEVTEDLAAYSQKQLEAAGIRVLLKTGVRSAQGDLIELTNGEKIRARTFIWAAGIEANRLVGELNAPKGKGKSLKVTPELALKEFEGVWAVGDSAEVPRPDGKGTYGATAQNATREGKLVARNIVRLLRKQPLRPFLYTPIGELALVGRRRGVARIYNRNFHGFTAYVLWRMIYLAKLPSMTQRIRVLSDWFLDAILGPTAKFHHISALPNREKLSATQESAASA
ncbi:MAG: FAD-dependent oxidoreductase [Acidobacteriaceae bacterium]|nr:FAD-dependent oxidoreductase [Acidobacteriaceae bacterium]